ncbi:MAG: hypothetical protein HN769_07055 [Anaerolineae bacterium]|jgi:hypothetical protein|nr:hypothetical protein [Anaerolineae bacterium]
MQASLYLRLYHGRKDPQEDLEDWGSEGPIFGPYISIQITYGAHIKMHTPEGFADLFWEDDLIYYDGIYYCDIGISSDQNTIETTHYQEEKNRSPKKDEA